MSLKKLFKWSDKIDPVRQNIMTQFSPVDILEERLFEIDNRNHIQNSNKMPLPMKMKITEIDLEKRKVYGKIIILRPKNFVIKERVEFDPPASIFFWYLRFHLRFVYAINDANIISQWWGSRKKPVVKGIPIEVIDFGYEIT